MLEGVRIADMTTMLMGPYCTQILADLGADVIKVEPAGGDQNRSIGVPARSSDMGWLHMTVNRGKRSVAWDLNSREGREAIERLLGASDIFIHNIRAKAIDRLGLGYEAVRAIRPDVVYVHCVGFGSQGPYANLQAFDDVIQAASGLAALAPHVDDDPRPRYLPTAIADKVAGLHAVYATLAGLFHRQRTGEGQRIEVPMMEALTSFTLVEHLAGRTFSPPTGPMVQPTVVDRHRRPVRTKDGYIAFTPIFNPRWAELFRAAGHPELIDDPRLKPFGGRPPIGPLCAVFGDMAEERTTAEWLELCERIAVPAMRVNTLEDLFEDPHLRAVGLLRERVHPTEGDYIEVQPPVRFSARPQADIRPPPRVAQDNEDVLRELGL